MRFGDLDGWKRARKLSADIYKELNNLKEYQTRSRLIFYPMSKVRAVSYEHSNSSEDKKTGSDEQEL